MKRLEHPVTISANPPYIAHSEQLPIDVERFEPALALRSDSEGLGFIKSLLSTASTFLPSSSTLFLECGSSQANTLVSFMKECNYCDCDIVHDLEKRPRIISGVVK